MSPERNMAREAKRLLSAYPEAVGGGEPMAFIIRQLIQGSIHSYIRTSATTAEYADLIAGLCVLINALTDGAEKAKDGEGPCCSQTEPASSLSSSSASMIG